MRATYRLQETMNIELSGPWATSCVGWSHLWLSGDGAGPVQHDLGMHGDSSCSSCSSRSSSGDPGHVQHNPGMHCDPAELFAPGSRPGVSTPRARLENNIATATDDIDRAVRGPAGLGVRKPQGDSSCSSCSSRPSSFDPDSLQHNPGMHGDPAELFAPGSRPGVSTPMGQTRERHCDSQRRHRQSSLGACWSKTPGCCIGLFVLISLLLVFSFDGLVLLGVSGRLEGGTLQRCFGLPGKQGDVEHYRRQCRGNHRCFLGK